jgi:anti-sigma28 factor (negative regulator of flagellin synthesis)
MSTRRQPRQRRRLDPELARALAQGTYVVDARAVADAMLRRRDSHHEQPACRRLFER